MEHLSSKTATNALLGVVRTLGGAKKHDEFRALSEKLLAEQIYDPEKVSHDAVKVGMAVSHWVDQKNPDQMDGETILAMKKIVDLYRSSEITKVIASGGIFDKGMKRTASEIQQDWYENAGIPKADILSEKTAVDLRGDIRNNVQILGTNFDKSHLVVAIESGIVARAPVQLQNLRETKTVPPKEKVDVSWLVLENEMDPNEVAMREIVEIAMMTRLRIGGIQINLGDVQEKLIEAKRRLSKFGI